MARSQEAMVRQNLEEEKKKEASKSQWVLDFDDDEFPSS
jgi:hypothetical protein